MAENDFHILTEQNRRNGVVVKASSSQSIDLKLIFLIESYQQFLKMIFTASLLGVQHNRDSVENKPAISLVVFMGKTLRPNGMPPILWLTDSEAKQSTRCGYPIYLKTSKKG